MCSTFVLTYRNVKVLQGFAIDRISTGLGCGKPEQVKNLLYDAANIVIKFESKLFDFRNTIQQIDKN